MFNLRKWFGGSRAVSSLHMKPQAYNSGRKARFRYPGKFTAGGKTYENWNQLCHRETETPGVYTDIYGRSVFFDAERFPCFDSDDFLYENRFYRWFFILEKGKITRVFYTDERKEIDITEDVANIEDNCWSKLGRLHFWDAEAGKDQNRA